MNLTIRGIYLLLFLPAVLLGAGPGTWFNWSLLTEATTLQRNLDAAEKATPAPEKILQTSVQVRQRELEIKQLETATATDKQRWDTLAGQCTNTAQRNDRREKLTHLLTRSGLSLLEDGPHDGDKANKDVKLSASLEALAKQMGEQTPGRHPLLWQLHLYGSYASLCRALEELAEGDMLAIPVGLSMKAVKNGGEGREWFLLVWI